MSLTNWTFEYQAPPTFPRIRKAVQYLDDIAKAFWTRHRDRRRYKGCPTGSPFEARRHVFGIARDKVLRGEK